MNINGKDGHFTALQQAFDAPWPGPLGDAVSLKSKHIEVAFYPQDAARMTSLKAFGFELLRQWNPTRRAFQYGSFPLVPWVGRLGNGQLEVDGHLHPMPVNKPPHALHGMACYSHWHIVEKTAQSLTVSMALTDPWPWKGQVVQHVVLQDDGLTLRLEIQSDSETFPAAAGWHPWFSKWVNPIQRAENLPEHEALLLAFDPDWQEASGDNELPTGHRISPRPGPWDDCFGFENGLYVRLEWPGSVAMEMTSSAPGLVVFDKQPDAACVNPLTQAPNAINTSPEYVSPQKPLIIETHWRFIPL